MKSDSNHCKSFLKAVISTAVLMITHAVITLLTYHVSLPKQDEITDDGMRAVVVTIFISALFYFLFVKMQTIYNNTLRRKYFDSKQYPKRMKFVLTTWEYWLNIAGYALMIFAVDSSKAFPILAEVFNFGGSLQDRLKIAICILPFLIILNLWARYNAVNSWVDNKDDEYFMANPELGNDPMAKNSAKLVPTSPMFSAMRFLSRTYSENAFGNPDMVFNQANEEDFSLKSKIKSFAWILIACVLLILGNKLVYLPYQLLVTIILPFLKTVLIETKIIIVIAVLILLIFAFKRIKALLSRRSFMTNLKKVCLESGSKCSQVKHPYSSLFSMNRNENFRITVKGKKYSCKFISCTKQNVPLVINEDGNGTFVHAITFAGIKWFQVSTKFNFHYKSDIPQILIINPSSKFTYSFIKGSTKEIDNGDYVGKYKVYTANGFINAIQRNCLDR